MLHNDEVLVRIHAQNVDVVRVTRLELGQGMVLGTIHRQFRQIPECDWYFEEAKRADITPGGLPQSAFILQVTTKVDALDAQVYIVERLCFCVGNLVTPQIRSIKFEIRNKSRIRNTNVRNSLIRSVWDLRFRASSLFRISCLEFRIFRTHQSRVISHFLGSLNLGPLQKGTMVLAMDIGEFRG